MRKKMSGFITLFGFGPMHLEEMIGLRNVGSVTYFFPDIGRNMNGHGASTLGPVDPDCSRLDERVVDPQPSVEQPQEGEPPAEIQDITPEKEEENGKDPVNPDEEKEKDASEDSVLESDLRELAVAKTGGQGGDGPDVKEEIASNREPVEMPEAGEGQPFA